MVFGLSLALATTKQIKIPDCGVCCSLGAGVLEIEVGVRRFSEPEIVLFGTFGLAFGFFCFCFSLQVSRRAGVQFLLCS